MTVRVYPHQPAIVMGLVADFLIELEKLIEPELDSFVMEELRSRTSRVTTLALLPMVGVVGRSLALDSALAVFDCCGPGLAEVGPDGTLVLLSGGAVFIRRPLLLLSPRTIKINLPGRTVGNEGERRYPLPSPRETAPASSYARTSRIPSAPPEFVVALAFSPRLTPYTLSLWIGEFFRGSLELE